MAAHRPERIVVALELSEADRPLLQVAETYARAFAAEVYMIHVVPEDPAFVGMPKEGEATGGVAAEDTEIGYAYDRDLKAERARAGHGALQAERERFEATGGRATALLIEGLPDQKIVEQAGRLGAQLIVVGSRKRSAVGEWLFGSTAREVMRHAPCPVLLVPLPD